MSYHVPWEASKPGSKWQGRPPRCTLSVSKPPMRYFIFAHRKTAAITAHTWNPKASRIPSALVPAMEGDTAGIRGHLLQGDFSCKQGWSSTDAEDQHE